MAADGLILKGFQEACPKKKDDERVGLLARD